VTAPTKFSLIEISDDTITLKSESINRLAEQIAENLLSKHVYNWETKTINNSSSEGFAGGKSRLVFLAE
jgi:hypothetical protein